MSSLPPPPEAPEGFWPDAFASDRKLHREAQSQQGVRLVHHTARDVWEYVAPLDQTRDDAPYASDDRRRIVFWKSVRNWGKWSINGQLNIIEPIPPAPGTDPDTLPAVETIYVYSSPGERPRASALVVAKLGYTGFTGELTQEFLDKRRELIPEAAQLGLIYPTPGQFVAFLEEMQRGASGEHRMIVPPSALLS